MVAGPRGRFRPFVGTGANILHPRFQVNFTNLSGFTDNTRVRSIDVELRNPAVTPLAGARAQPYS